MQINMLAINKIKTFYMDWKITGTQNVGHRYACRLGFHYERFWISFLNYAMKMYIHYEILL